ncbi:MAG: YbdD/YjiX family protein [Magnetococcales bacterium]|nr:YbdD/YjiX family protein [Magnetococcales bacterium]
MIELEPVTGFLTKWFSRVSSGLPGQTALAMIGYPDYRAYVAHREEHHPGEPLLSEREFLQDRLLARYGGRKGRPVRCC